MSYDDATPSGKKKTISKPHNITMEDRARLTVSGVEDVESFDEREIVMRTSAGTLVITGADLSVSRLSVDTGDVNVQGLVTALCYEEAVDKRSLWARLFH